MKNKNINLFLAILFSWIIVSGTVYADTRCRAQGSDLCCQTFPQGSKTTTSISNYTYDSQSSTILPLAAGKNQFCCKDKICKSEGEFFLRTQNANFQKQAVAFSYNPPEPLNGYRTINPVFAQYKTIQTISIYTITQAFLC